MGEGPIRFTQKNGELYLITLKKPAVKRKLAVRCLGKEFCNQQVAGVTALATEKPVRFTQEGNRLVIALPFKQVIAFRHTMAFRVTFT